MGGWRSTFSEAVMNGLRSLDPGRRGLVLRWLKCIEANPFSPTTDVRELPPMHAPGTFDATFGDIRIRYCVKYEDDNGGEIRFLRIFILEA